MFIIRSNAFTRVLVSVVIKLHRSRIRKQHLCWLVAATISKPCCLAHTHGILTPRLNLRIPLPEPFPMRSTRIYKSPSKPQWKQLSVVVGAVVAVLLLLMQLSASHSASLALSSPVVLNQPLRVQQQQPTATQNAVNASQVMTTGTPVEQPAERTTKQQQTSTDPDPKDQQSIDAADKALNKYRIQQSTVPRKEKPNAFYLDLPLANTTDMPHWQQTIVYKRAASERLARGGDAVSPIPLAPRVIHTLRPDRTTDRSKPILAIITATRSHEEEKAAQSDLQKRLIRSIQKTISPMEQKLWHVQLWIGVDDVDDWWIQNWSGLEAPPWLDVYIAIIPDKIHRVPFTEVAYAAYTSETPPDYLVRVNDDTEFLTPRWLTLAVTKLQQYDPPNVGVVGPECQAGNTMILTHDFVHATHMEIFQGYYYPTVFRNWYLDDWISVGCLTRYAIVCGSHFVVGSLQRTSFGRELSSQDSHAKGMEGEALDIRIQLRSRQGRCAMAPHRVRARTETDPRTCHED